jgi:hypothetical protein
MAIGSLIKNALIALTAFLELKNKAFYYDIIQQSRSRQKDIVNEIEKLRSTGTNSSNDRADLLRAELLAEKRYIEHLSTVYSLSGKG